MGQVSKALGLRQQQSYIDCLIVKQLIVLIMMQEWSIYSLFIRLLVIGIQFCNIISFGVCINYILLKNSLYNFILSYNVFVRMCHNGYMSYMSIHERFSEMVF